MAIENEAGEAASGDSLHESSPQNLGETIVGLESQHSNLEKQLIEEEARPHPDSAAINALKRQKLAIKDRIAALQTR